MPEPMFKDQKLDQAEPPQFITLGNTTPLSVAFNPVDRDNFVVGTGEGSVQVYHAGRRELISVSNVVNTGQNRQITALKFTNDGLKVLTCSNTKKLLVVDVETGSIVQHFENCTYNAGHDRAALTVDPFSATIAASNYINGKGVTFFDLRMPLPFDFHFDFHNDVIKDMVYLDPSWPFVKTNPSVTANNLLTISAQGVAKVSTTDGTVLRNFDFNHSTNAVTITPESFGSCASSGFTSSIIAAGPVISSYTVPGTNYSFTSPSFSSSSSSSSSSAASSANGTFGSSSESGGGGGGGAARVSVYDHNLSRLSRSLNTNGRGGDHRANSFETFNPTPPNFMPIPPFWQGDNEEGLAAAGHNAPSNGNIFNIMPNVYNAVSSEQASYSRMRSFALQQRTLASGQLQNHQLHHYQQPPLPPLPPYPPQPYPMMSGHNSNWSFPVLGGQESGYQAGRNLSNLPANLATLSNGGGSLLMPLVDEQMRNDQAIHPAPAAPRLPPASLRPSSRYSPPQPLIVFHHHWIKDQDDADGGGARPPEVTRLRFSTNGAFLYAGGEGGAVRLYQRTPHVFHLKYLGDLMQHEDDIIDLDLSPNDEYLVTTSHDKTVGIVHLGPPNHGSSGHYEIA